MKLGTALSASSTKALLLGCGELGKELAIALQRFGVEVIAVDRYANAPAQQVAHRSYVIDMTDSQAVKDLIAKEQPNFIIPEIEAIATQALLEIEAEGKATVVPNARAIQLTMNREGIRTLAAVQLDIPTSQYAFAETFQELATAVDNGIGYPCFIKPTMSSSGKGQSMVKSADQLKPAWDYAKSSGRVDTGKVIVEAKIDFDFEITLLTVRALNEQGEIETHFCEPIGHRQESGDYRESWQPQAMTDAALKSSQEIAYKVTNEIGGLGLFGVELFIKDDYVWFSEVSPRPHDTGMVTMVTQYQSEFDLHARAILGLPVNAQSRSAGASAVILAASQGKDVTYENLDKALAVPESEVRLFAKPEALVNRRMGVALASANTIEEARKRAVKAASLVVVKSI
ncbi:MAG: formate-dependent phosphoribosylglycinamide formyltransferase [Methylococcaceae bacterium]|jgi:phosphoribosylglycinamide formyltransferase 2|nr:formate-dependent phosphoribosylglycinamide formyltransferase [Methylococcaceae bacterium]MDZ4155349.1 formate-dependent phosphoribosylglycinamide formyltransferase [Methylococcales bacterium]MDP2393961.1 formate-dependent phosphoribosylglycinamide formyltransferase [Methylococcaceae bacterium]MDP3018051.1 formate-dependent phosphoribosylglycinamide formyltransferase [Methylococcaceae bacterium]MDP3391838.1 formate-dependent phosphoribosylglycinamide formyltransferase [Methylococcaceae bacte